VSGSPIRRLVTMARQPSASGSIGRTCSGANALSSTTKVLVPYSFVWYSAALRLSVVGICSAGTPSSSSSRVSASETVTGATFGVKPLSRTRNWPSG
jgi:hypothetical protein